MYCSFTKTQSFPLVFVRPTMLKQIYTSKPQSLLKSVNLFGGINCSLRQIHCSNELGNLGMFRRTLPSGLGIKHAILNGQFIAARRLSSSSPGRIGEGGKKALTWLKKEKAREVRRSKTVLTAMDDDSPWEVSVENYLKRPPQSGEEKKVYGSRSRHTSYRDGDRGGDGSKKTSPWLAKEKSREVKRNKSVVTENTNKSTWEVSAEKYLKGASPSGEDAEKYLKGTSPSGDGGGDDSKTTLPWLAEEKSRELRRNKTVVTENANKSPLEVPLEKYLKGGPAEDVEDYRSRNRYTGYRNGGSYRDENGDSEGEEEEEEEEKKEEEEGYDDPRWDKIKTRFNGEVEARPVADSPELKRWNKQEKWGKKTWKEATESTVPKLSGEVIYGVGPVLAAVCSGRRELYALYVQEGLDLSGNNRKKKDKKGVEKILRMAEKIGLNKKELSKHDLNMASDNRPHQGLVLDASPLEMVGIKELEPVSVDEQNMPLWVALDEVTDPQNLGAIIRSSYFFGASGVVLCAKNSAPLSGVVSKASAGSLEMVELRSCKNMMQFLTSSAENGWRVIGGSVSSRAVPLDDIAPGAPTIIVLGSEGTGLRPLVERSCSQLVKIPGNAPPNLIVEADGELESAEAGEQFQTQYFRSFMAVESLNVSVAAGVLLHHFIGLNYKHNNPIQETE